MPTTRIPWRRRQPSTTATPNGCSAAVDHRQRGFNREPTHASWLLDRAAGALLRNACVARLGTAWGEPRTHAEREERDASERRGKAARAVTKRSGSGYETTGLRFGSGPTPSPARGYAA